MNETASGYWKLAEAWIHHADTAEDVNTTICYTGMAECALKMAQFAVNNPLLVKGIDEYAIPPGGTRNEAGIPVPGTPAPPQPSGGPKVWGAPTP